MGVSLRFMQIQAERVTSTSTGVGDSPCRTRVYSGACHLEIHPVQRALGVNSRDLRHIPASVGTAASGMGPHILTDRRVSHRNGLSN